MDFTSSQLIIHVYFAIYPLELLFLFKGSPWPVVQNRGGDSWPDSGEEAHRRRGLGWGKGRGGRELRFGGLGSRREGRTGLAGGGQGAAAMVLAGGGVPIRERRGARAGKVQGAKGNPFRG